MLDFIKYQGTGNDYLFLNGLDSSPDNHQSDWPRLAQLMSDRHYGVGADGIIVAVSPVTELAPVRMRMFNADGSEGEMCGNGLRCFAKYVIEQNLVRYTHGSLKVETGAGVLDVEPVWESQRIIGARTSMGEPILRAVDVPVDQNSALPSDLRKLDRSVIQGLGLETDDLIFEASVTIAGSAITGTGVSMGNPHFISFLDSPVYDTDLSTIGPLVEHHAAFPNRVNWSIVNVSDRTHLIGRTWERGAGITLACGTGVCATMVAARLHNWVDERVSFSWPGGELFVTWPGYGPVILEGDAVEVFAGTFPD